MNDRPVPFLKQIAVAYDRENPDGLSGYIFVFPNRRSSLFFQKYLREAKGARLSFNTPFLSPETTTFDDLIEHWSDTARGERSELLIVLYRSYLSVVSRLDMPEESAMDLSSFMFWGDVILNDFDEIDLAMADASDVFRNLRDYKSIETNPLDSEKWQLIKQFWDTTGLEHLIPDESDESRMWFDYSLPGGNSEIIPAARSFLKIWQILGLLYTDFRERLIDMGLHYRGMAFRRVVERIKKDIDIVLRDNVKYVFAGFGNVSESELSLMDILHSTGIADFFWDVGLPFLKNGENRPAKFVERLSEKYPSPFPLDISEHTPRINIVGVPSEIGQVKEASAVLSEFKIEPHEASSTAVVLAEESLCVPLLHSLNLGDDIDVNITIGYPLRLSSVASVVEIFTLIHTRARYMQKERVTTYFKDDVKKLLSHPLVIRLAYDECRGLENYISKLNLYNIPADKLQNVAGRLSPLFESVKGDSTSEAFNSIRRAIICLLSLFPVVENQEPSLVDGQEPIDDNIDLWILDRGFLQGYLDELDELENNICELLDEKVRYGGTSVMRSIAKIMLGRKVGFNGAPLRGLQIMGIDETRTLDFERIVALSMNERVFPKRFQSPTFIPQTLRRAYNLPTIEKKEAETAYWFYRMLSRAKEVVLIYNANTEGLSSGEMSRYLYQLIYAYKPKDLAHSIKNYKIGVFHNNEIKLEKDDAVMAELAKFLPDSPEDKRRFFSASSIRQLLDCELKFYLEYIAGFRLPDEIHGYIDDSVYGKIVHETFENLYNHQAFVQKRSDNGALLTPELLKSLIKNPLLDRYIVRAINHIYHKREGSGIAGSEDELDTQLDGESKLFAALIKKSVLKVIEAEADWLEGKYEVIYLHAESKDKMVLTLANDMKINFSHIIDRIDIVKDTHHSESYLRLVDYKTGQEELSASTVEYLVDYELSKGRIPPHGITQLMLYCNSYREVTGNKGRIQPYIYSLREIMNSGRIDDLKVGPKRADPITGKMSKSLPILSDYREINDEFMHLMSAKIERLFDRKIPFAQVENESNCRYCNFREICNR